MSHPTVSILIPVYNREDYIGECIESALKQSFVDFEIVIVDNASNDKTWEICEEYASLDHRIRIYRNDENIGPVRNWLACLDYANGEYGKILFSDDLMRPDCLESTILLFNPDVGFVFSQVMLGEKTWSGEGECCWHTATGIYDASSFIDASLYGGSGVPVSPCAGIFRLKDIRNALESEISIPNVSDFLDYGAGPDLFVFLMAANRYKKVGYNHEMLMFFRVHSDSISTAQSETVPERYGQTRMYFAGEYLNTHQFNRVLMLEWLSSMKRKRKFIGFKSFYRLNCNEKHAGEFSVSVLFWASIKLIGNIIKGRWPRRSPIE